MLDSLSEAPALIAYEQGYFKEEGLDVEFVSFSNTADMVAPLSARQLDVASGAPTLALFNGALRGLPFKLVADKGAIPRGTDSMHSWCARTSSIPAGSRASATSRA